MKKETKIFIASDHAGFDVKEKVKEFLDGKKIRYEDLSKKYKEGDDYPDYAFEAAKRVAKNDDSRGILICGTGTGMIIAANKVRGIRAVAAYDFYSAQKSREDNNANVLGLRGRNFPFAKIKRIISIWLNTEFSKKEKYKRRIMKIKNYES